MSDINRNRKNKPLKKASIYPTWKWIAIGLIPLIVILAGLKFWLNQSQKNKEAVPVPTASLAIIPTPTISPPAAPLPAIPTPAVSPPAPVISPAHAVLPKSEKQLSAVIRKPELPLPGKLPKIAIIIDDIGYDYLIAAKYINLNIPLTLSLFPHSPYQRQIIQLAREKGVDLMLHLPMEPLGYPRIDPGPGALITSMSPDELTDQLNDDLDAVPYIKGVNNHMGSKFTESSELMNIVISDIKRRDLFFVDSRTSTKSQAGSSARLFHIPYAERDIFLDNIEDSQEIRKQIQLLLQKALKNGHAIAIGHPHSLTYQTLQEELPEIHNKVQIVTVSELVHPAG